MVMTSSRVRTDTPVAVIGAGPYGLSVTGHLRKAGISTHTFGDPMSFWRDHMPAGMLLRSAWTATNIGASSGPLTLDAFAAARGRPVAAPVPLPDFIEYGLWYQQAVAPDVDSRMVRSVMREDGMGFALTLDDGDVMRASRVVVAAGIARFARRPPMFAHLSVDQVSHTVDHDDLSRFAGQTVVVIGSGQSALESVALLNEAGAAVEMVARASEIAWLRKKRGSDPRWLDAILYTRTDVGPPGLNRLTEVPGLFRRLPRSTQSKLAYRAIRPAGAGWLIDRVGGVSLTLGRAVRTAEPMRDGRVRLELGDGTTRDVDHVLLATGYQVDVSRYEFLDEAILAGLELAGGYPVLGPGLESTVAGLHFAGASAAWSFGPLTRFVSGSWYCGAEIARTASRGGRRLVAR